MHIYFKKTSNTDRISSSKSKGLSDEIIKLATTSDNILSSEVVLVTKQE